MPQASWVGRNGALTFRCNIISSISWFRWLSLSTGCLTTQIEFCCRPSPVFWRFWSAKIQLRLASCQQQEVCRLTNVRTCIYAPMQLYLCSNAIVFVHQFNCICVPMPLYFFSNAIVFVHQFNCICAPMQLHLCTNAKIFVPKCYFICAPIQLYLCTNVIVFVLQWYCICAPIHLHLCTNAIVFVHQCNCICETCTSLVHTSIWFPDLVAEGRFQCRGLQEPSPWLAAHPTFQL